MKCEATTYQKYEGKRLKQGIRYVITRGTKDNTLITGDRVVLGADGTLNNMNAGGWIAQEDVDKSIKEAEFKVDVEHYRKLRQATLKQLSRIDEILDMYEKEK